MKFTRKDEDKLVALFRTYTEQKLNEFIGRAIAERLLLTLGLTEDNERISETLGMLNVLSRVQEAAGMELRKRKGQRHEAIRVQREIAHSRPRCPDCWSGFVDRPDHFIDRKEVS